MGSPEVLGAPDEAEAHVSEWRALVASQPWTSYFSTPDWQLAWWQTLGRRRAGRLALWHGSGGLDAVVGLVREPLHPRLPLRGPWAGMGSGPGAADHLGWVVRPQCREDVHRWLRRTVGRGTLVLSGCDPESGAAEIVPGLRPVATTPCPRVELHAPLPTGSSKLRKRVRYDERKLAEEGIVFSWLAPGHVTAEVLDDLMELHGSRAGDQGWSSSFTTARRQFHLALLGRATAECGPAAMVARRGEQVVGVLYGFQWRTTFAYYQTGWDQSLAHFGLGTVLVANAMQAAHAEGCRVFDFLRGPEPYKYRFGATDRYDTTWVAGRGPLARWVVSRHTPAPDQSRT